MKTILYHVLDEFEIPLAKALCCVTDNASNMIKLVKDFNEDLSGSSQATDENPESDEEEMSGQSDTLMRLRGRSILAMK